VSLVDSALSHGPSQRPVGVRSAGGGFEDLLELDL
jgi:hypothetical protein